MPQPVTRAGDIGPAPGGVTRPGRFWWLCSALVLAAAVVAALFRRREIAQAYDLIARVRPPGLVVAMALEAMSLLCFAAVPRWLLRVGGVRWSMARMTCTTVAANAMAGALPAGAAFSAAWLLRHLSRRGAGGVLAAAVLVTSGAASAAGLCLLFAAGVAVAGPAGPGALVRPVTDDVLLPALVAALVLLALSRFAGCRRLLRRVRMSTGRRYPRVRRAESDFAGVVRQARAAEPRPLPWLWPLGYAFLNWLLDAAALAAGMWALGIEVPWRGLLLSYALTQLAGSLHLTPGNLGIAEATLSALLVVSGLPAAQAIAATFLYRIISYWALQPVGWTCWVGLALEEAHAARGGR
ncbi:lysylphosphatidylglycerol synthase transmembrane domain-containing protein [Streptomyces sasae]|uniref:lysylphosphatidylglycerol synthase transmembrane domain-containing protein n=1 Tax=Streptomyces sasae TaxID=1266772 RepID=UPI00292FAF27|nr:YbhN family protein [Streptomyces sasae]